MFGSRSSQAILMPYLQRHAAAYYIHGPQRDAFIEQTVAVIATDPEVIVDGPFEKMIAEALARVYAANKQAAE